MLNRDQKNNTKNLQVVDIDSLVPQNHLVRKVDKVMQFDFIYDIVEHLYSDDMGRPSIDPVVLFKIVFIQYLFNIRSMRRTIEEIEVNVAYRWFLGYDFSDDIPHFSTFGKNYVRRFKDTDIFEEIFNTILYQAMNLKLVKMDNIFVDSTHIKAYANKRRVNDILINDSTHKYVKQLHEEINELRLKEGKKIIDYDSPKKAIISLTDPDCGMFHKGEKERQLAYSNQVISDENGWVLSSEMFAGNLHDSITVLDTVVNYLDTHKEVKVAVMDSGYDNPILLNEIYKRKVLPVLPYKRPKGKDGSIGLNGERHLTKDRFDYIEMHDYYICPNEKILTYRGTNKLGYREYKTRVKDCIGCPFKAQCTNQKTRSLTRHQLEYVNPLIKETRLSEIGRELYPKRKSSVERVFGISKMNHCLGVTYLRGRQKNEDRSFMIFSMYNLKKLAALMWT
ncbi:transposase [Mariniplasma anaerobium]|uniref:Transposase n=1 Tax=Mariniplasma anaerobium TaxID=2735436 RepID=A0A7R7VAN4_9MOLU|nr:transposase [Mariniplasma anaerobium]BCR36869.1 transposase [Mariniplasma anaerobium]